MLPQCLWICYDCIPLLIAKFEAYDLDKINLHLLRDYLSNREQSTKIGYSFSNREL